MSEEDDQEYARRRAMASATVLGWLQANNCELSSETQIQLAELRKADARWRPEWDSSADESHEGRAGWVGVNTDASQVIDVPLAQIIPLAEEHTRQPVLEFTEYRPFAGLVKERPFRALSALSLEARNGRYPARFWQSALTEWPDETSERLRCLFANRLARLPDEIVFELRDYLPQWFRTHFPRLAKDRYGEYLPLWDLVIDHFFALGPEATISGIGEISVGGKPINRSRRTCEHSINGPIGNLVEGLFDVLNDLKLTRRKGIPADIRSRLELLWNAPGEGADHAVCETTRHLRWLFALDPIWVTDRVIPMFDLANPLSEPAWNGLLWTDRLPEAEIFALLKPHFLKAFPQSSSWAWDDTPINRLNEFLVVACYWNVKSHQYISYEEARAALQQATEEGRAHAIWFLTTIVRDLNEWKKFGKPFVQKAWPRERKFQTSTSSRNFAHLAEEAGDHFPDVVKTILPFVGPVDHPDMLIHAGTRNDDDSQPLAARFPEPMLALLDRIVPDISAVSPHDLRPVLDMIVAAAPTLRQDERWRQLDAIAG